MENSKIDISEYTLLTKDTPFLRKIDWDFFNCCKDYYKSICVLMTDSSCKVSMDWKRHSPNVCNVCVYGDPNSSTKGRHGTWPAIWSAVQKAGVSGGCGNSHQHQIKYDNSLVQIAYVKYKSNWYYKFGPRILKLIEKLKENTMDEILRATKNKVNPDKRVVFYVRKGSLVTAQRLKTFLEETSIEVVSPFGSDKTLNMLHELQSSHFCICPSLKSYVFTKGTYDNPEISVDDCIRKINGHLNGESFGL